MVTLFFYYLYMNYVGHLFRICKNLFPISSLAFCLY